MLSRILWVSVAGLALVAGIMLQDGRRIFSWGDERESRAERTIEDRVEHALDRSFDHMQVVDSEGRNVDVPAETKRAMADAVGRLVKAETELAMTRIGDGSDREARARRDEARAEVDRLKAEIKGFERSAKSEHDALREQIQRDVREDVRDATGS